MFNVGEKVSLKIDKDRAGEILSILQPFAGHNRYRVIINGKTNNYTEEQLIPALNDKSGIFDFSVCYGLHKLNQKSIDSMFSLNTGKIEFNPFQYRPLERILKSDYPRILIADEVGVGKTIEAGLIFTEFKKRNNLDTCLIICPKELTTKWKEEMSTKFGEDFDILDSSSFSYCIKESELDDWPLGHNKCIIGLEMARRKEYVERLQSLKDSLHFDLLIVDEVHHAINTESYSHAIVDFFCQSSSIVVFLSATPIQLAQTDLFSLLNMLRPDEFPSAETFVQMAEPNESINAAIRILRSRCSNSIQDALTELNKVCQVNNWANKVYSEDPVLSYWRDRLSTGKLLSEEELVECVQSLQNLHSFSSIINRTKRKDIKEFTIREPITVDVPYCPIEQAFYECARGFKSETLKKKYGKHVANLIMSTVERQLTSCIPAFVNVLDRFIERGILSIEDLGDDFSDDDDDTVIQYDSDDFIEWAEELKSLSRELPEKDRKTEELLRIIKDTLINTESKKILVFSFFRHTLSYLLEKIREAGIRVEVITGDTPADEKHNERKRIRDAFRKPYDDPDAIDVLLSSEVGCEGLDYEFCSRLVNYDIPWNPMKIEQRIGRIDRFGQKSPKVQIFNFVTQGTIEEKIFYRCFYRLGVFNNTIGDLEGVLGEITKSLTEAALDTSLTSEQLDEREKQIEYLMENKRQEAIKFETEARPLLIMDVEQDADAMQEEKVLQSLFMQKVLQHYIENELPRSVITVRQNAWTISIHPDDKINLLATIKKMKSRSRLDRNDRQVKRLEKFLRSDERYLHLLFDREDYEEERYALDFNISNPLIVLSLIGQSASSVEEWSLSVVTDLLSPGAYSFGCYTWKEEGLKQIEKIKIVISDSTGRIIDCDTHSFEQIILSATSKKAELDNATKGQLDLELYDIQQDAVRKLVEENRIQIDRKIATLEEYYSREIHQYEKALETVSDERIKRMHRGALSRLSQRYEEKLKDLNNKKNADIYFDCFAYGRLDVRGE